MPMTAEEQKAFDEAKAASEAAKAEAAKLKEEIEKLKNPPKPPKDDESILEQVRKKELEAENQKAKEKVIADAAKFSVSISALMKDNEGFFPSEVEGILEVNAKKPYESELDRANDLRSTLIESVFSVKKNLELLPQSVQEKINTFLSLTQKKREEKASDIWEYVIIASNNYKQRATIERAEKVRKGLAPADGAQAEYDKKILGLRSPKKEND